MKNLIYFFGLLLFIFSNQNSYSQKVYGVIVDANTKEPIVGASVYFDSTTIGVSTNFDGEFFLDYNPNIKSPLVISFMGYKTIRINDFFIEQKQKFFLKASNETLNEISINTDDGLPREKKLEEFIKYFLGETENARSCEILNKEDLILRYNKDKKQITAKSNAQIIVKNENLKYIISVDLNHFEINYSRVSKNKKNLTAESISYYGSFFFQSTEEKLSTKTIEKREDAYEGSTLHFMRALSKNKLFESGYLISKSDRSVKNVQISIEQLNHTTLIAFNNKIHVKFKNGNESSVEILTDNFYIDSFGNHSPPDKVRFEGDFGNKRIGDALPLNYLLVESN